jgi:hypothetical protein
LADALSVYGPDFPTVFDESQLAYPLSHWMTTGCKQPYREFHVERYHMLPKPHASHAAQLREFEFDLSTLHV